MKFQAGVAVSKSDSNRAICSRRSSPWVEKYTEAECMEHSNLKFLELEFTIQIEFLRSIIRFFQIIDIEQMHCDGPRCI
jgi:hypothetical protein